MNTKFTMFMLVLAFMYFLQVGEAAEIVVKVNLNFTELQAYCYDEAKYLTPPISSGGNLSIRTLTGVEDKQMCAVECALLPACAGFQFKPSSKVCYLATACEFWGKWKTSGGVCETEFAFDRSTSCAIPQWVKDLNVSALYNFRRGPSNVIDVTKYRLVEQGTGLTFGSGGVAFHGTGYLQIHFDDVLELTNELKYGSTWSIWTRIKRKANNDYTRILNSLYNANAYEVIRFVLNYNKIMLRFWESERQVDEVTEDVITTNFTRWSDIGISFNGTKFTIVLDGEVVTARTVDTNIHTAGGVTDNKFAIGHYYGGNMDGEMACFGVALAIVNAAEFVQLFGNYCKI